MIGQKGLDLIKHFEGFAPIEYICPAGKRTIGYGHVVLADEDFSQGITPAEAEILLLDDVVKAELSVQKVLDKVSLSGNQYDALVSLAFNIGNGAFENSTMFGCLMSGDYIAAAGEFTRWCKVGKRGLSGLLKRRIAEMNLFLDEA